MTVTQPFINREEEAPSLPFGWAYQTTEAAMLQLKPGKLFDKNSSHISGAIPILSQGEKGYVGYHNEAPGVIASAKEPVITFANHTCAMRLLKFPFSCIQNIFPKVGIPGKTDTTFLFYACQGRVTLSEYKGHHPLFRQALIPVPPLTVQRRIASILHAYDELIEINRRRVAVLENMARQLFEEWFVRLRFPDHEAVAIQQTDEGPLPTGWRYVPLADACSMMRSGTTPARKEATFWQDATIDWFTTGELWDGFLLDSCERISTAAVNAGKARLFPEDTILMAIYGSPTLGRLGVTTKACSTNQAALGMQPAIELIGLWQLYHALYALRSKFNSMAQGAAQQNISKEKVARTQVLIAPPHIGATFESRVNAAMRLKRSLQEQNRVLTNARDFLLPRLLSGRLDVPAAERELAEAV